MTGAICDAFLISFLIEYAAVALPGMVGLFSALSMSVVALATAGFLCIVSGSPRVCERKDATYWSIDRLGLLGCGVFAVGFVGAYAWLERWAPPMATDSLVYHLPTVIQWMQSGRLGIYPSWYWNPAASYSPATGMTFMAWLMAPAGCDVFVRFVQVPPLVCIFFLTVRLCRVMGCGRTAAGLLGIAAMLSRSLFSEALIPKDDLFITAFVAAAILSLNHDALSERLAPWRVGIAMGLVLASKYTVLLACPVFLFLIDAPIRAGWRIREWSIAIGLVVVIALPWYMRNIVLTGNPLYPVDVNFVGFHLHGLFSVERDRQLRTAAGIWRMVNETYHSLPVALIALLLAGWIGTCIAGGRTLFRDPLRRACVLCSVVTLFIFLLTSPHHEARYMFPLLVLWFADIGLPLGAFAKSPARQAALALVPAAVSVATTFHVKFAADIATFASLGVVLVGVSIALVLLQVRILRLSRRWIASAGAAFAALLALVVYVDWHAYVSDYLALRPELWAHYQYPGQGPLWKFAAEQLPADASVAYANTYFVYPLYDPTYRRRVGYAPVRHGLHTFLRLPRMGDRVPGDLIFDVMAADMNSDADRATWMENLRALGATYLVVDKRQIVTNPPELRFARAEPELFQPMYEDEQGVVFRIIHFPH